MPKIVTPETLKADSRAHARAMQTAMRDLREALREPVSAADWETAARAAKVLEAGGCYVRRAAGKVA